MSFPKLPADEVMKTRRLLRIEEQIKRVVGEIIQKGARDPRIGFLSVTRAEVTPDLRQARVFVSVYGDEGQADETFQGLNSVRSFIQREMAGQISYRYTPVISFHLDKSLGYSARIDEVLKEIREKEAGERSGE